jgi:hypothetical protein
MSEKEHVLSEIKTLLRILNTWGNTLVPSLDGKEVTAKERLNHFVNRAQELGMTIDEIEDAIA